MVRAAASRTFCTAGSSRRRGCIGGRGCTEKGGADALAAEEEDCTEDKLELDGGGAESSRGRETDEGLVQSKGPAPREDLQPNQRRCRPERHDGRRKVGGLI